MGNLYSQDILNLLKKERQNLNYLSYPFSMVAREFSRKVIDEVNVQRMYLFGSVAKKTYREDSDIDFAIVMMEKKPRIDMALTGIADKLSRKYKRKIQYFILTKEQIKDKKNELVKEVLKHGIKLF